MKSDIILSDVGVLGLTLSRSNRKVLSMYF
jgi:hypothetical protein